MLPRIDVFFEVGVVPGPSDPAAAAAAEAAESELIARCRRGESAAWDEFFDAHFDGISRFVFQLSRDISREDAEELAQEVFLSAIRNLDRFRGKCRIQSWLFRIAVNKFRDFIQRRQTAKRGSGRRDLSLETATIESDDGPIQSVPAPIEPRPGPDACVIRKEQEALLERALETLGDPCREILELRYFGELSYEEIGDALHLNEKTVGSRLSRCLSRLEAIGKELMEGRVSLKTASVS